MEFRQNDELSFIEHQFAKEPTINVITKEQFEERVYKVFTIIWEKLSKSFGPGGAGTFISVYPSYFNTKDGFTIMKNIAFDLKLDQVICDMVMDICSRLNFVVGDGTTSATIATKSTYEAYLESKNFFSENRILPREILKRLERIKEEVITELTKRASVIRSTDPQVLRENIEKVVYISSNGNDDITNMIGEMYEQLMYPSITCVLSKDGMMHSNIINGYKNDVSLTDKLYINNDNNTMIISTGADVIMFDHRVTTETYVHILKPLSDACKGRGRNLICIAPYYDEVALSSIISQDLNNERKRTGKINLVLTVCKKPNGAAKIGFSDLAMLLNTTIITSSMETQFLEMIQQGGSNIYNFFDLDNRDISGITVCEQVGDGLRPFTYTKNCDIETFNLLDSEKSIRIGYCDNVELGMAESIFSGFYYDNELYNSTLSIAKDELEEIQRKCASNGTFSMDMTNKQKRVYSLGLKTGIIEVGASSDITTGYLKDTMDDAVKAAASAYNNGVVLGCNMTIISILSDMYDNTHNDIDKTLICMILNGFTKVYETVLSNIVENTNIEGINLEEKLEVFKSFISCDAYNRDEVLSAGARYLNTTDDANLYDMIKFVSVHTDTVFDVTSGEFTKDVINSTETDREILKATVDLLSLLITGNQLVLR